MRGNSLDKRLKNNSTHAKSKELEGISEGVIFAYDISDRKMRRRMESEKVRLRNNRDIPSIVNAFNDYLRRSLGRDYVVAGRRQLGGERVYYRIKNRYSPEYRKYLDDYLSGLPRDEDAVFLTLTFDPKRFTIFQAWSSLGSYWNTFMTVLKRSVWPNKLRYFRVVEVHKNGYPHIHAVFFGVRFLRYNGRKGDLHNRKTIYGMWGCGYTFTESVSGDVVDYVLKYVRKGLSVDDYTQNYGYAMMWLYNVRLFSMSRDLSRILKEKYLAKLRKVRRELLRKNPDYLHRAVRFEYIKMMIEREIIPVERRCLVCGTHTVSKSGVCVSCGGGKYILEYHIPFWISLNYNDMIKVVDVSEIKRRLIEDGLYYYDKVVWDKLLVGVDMEISVDDINMDMILTFEEYKRLYGDVNGL